MTHDLKLGKWDEYQGSIPRNSAIASFCYALPPSLDNLYHVVPHNQAAKSPGKQAKAPQQLTMTYIS